MTTEAAGQGPVNRVVRPGAEALRPLPKAGPVCFADAQSILTYTVPAVGRHLPGVLDVGLWTSDQMRAYADAAVAAERERCAKLCEGMRDEDRPSDYAWAIRTDWADEPQSAVAAAFGNINGRPGA